MDDNSQPKFGHSTKIALIKLRDDIQNVINVHKQKYHLRYLYTSHLNIDYK